MCIGLYTYSEINALTHRHVHANTYIDAYTHKHMYYKQAHKCNSHVCIHRHTYTVYIYTDTIHIHV